MTLWAFQPGHDHDLYTVLYLLKDALLSALSDACYFERAVCSKPDIRGAGHAEIAARLGRFRDTCEGLQQREALMLTKILRARTWASELKKLAPELSQEIEQFLDATELCAPMQAEFLKDAQRMFHGGGSLTRFLARRKPQNAGSPAQENHEFATGYLVGGKTALFELRAACEVFLAQVNDEFFTQQPAKGTALTAPLASYLESLDEKASAAALPPRH